MPEKQQYTEKSGDVDVLTPAGDAAIKPLVTDTRADVYAFTADANAVTVAAGMARLSRTNNELRETIAKEFLEHQGKDDELLHRVVTNFGDDSVAQLIMLQVGNESISNVAVKLVEDGRFGAYLERSSRYVDYSKKNSKGEFRYYRPTEFDSSTNGMYLTSMDLIFESYQMLYHDMKRHFEKSTSPPPSGTPAELRAWEISCHAQACDVARYILPMATSTTVGVVGSAQFYANNISRLLANPLPEAQDIGQRTLDAVRQVAPAFFERVDNPERGGLITDHRSETAKKMGSLAFELLGVTKPVKTSDVKLNWYSPEDEDLVLAAALFPHANLPTNEILAQVKNMTADQKERVWNTYIGDRFNRRVKPGRAFELPHYSFDINSDIGAFRDIHRHRVVDNPERQKFGIEYGYITPDDVADAGDQALEIFHRAFQHSERLFNYLNEHGYPEQAQYAALFGHRILFTQTMNAREAIHAIELRTAPQGHPSYRAKYKRMGELIAAVHPHIGQSMRFLDKSEDEQLARLGAELAVARKAAKR